MAYLDRQYTSKNTYDQIEKEELLRQKRMMNLQKKLSSKVVADLDTTINKSQLACREEMNQSPIG